MIYHMDNLKREKLLINMNNNRVQVYGTKTPQVRGDITSIVDPKQFVTKSVKPKSWKFRDIKPRFRHKNKVRFISNYKFLKSQSSWGVGDPPEVPVETLHFKDLDVPTLDLIGQLLLITEAFCTTVVFFSFLELLDMTCWKPYVSKCGLLVCSTWMSLGSTLGNKIGQPQEALRNSMFCWTTSSVSFVLEPTLLSESKFCCVASTNSESALLWDSSSTQPVTKLYFKLTFIKLLCSLLLHDIFIKLPSNKSANTSPPSLIIPFFLIHMNINNILEILICCY